MPSSGNAWIDLRNQSAGQTFLVNQFQTSGESTTWYNTQVTSSNPTAFVNGGAWSYPQGTVQSDSGFLPGFIFCMNVDPASGSIGPQFPYWASVGFDASGNIDPSTGALHPIAPNASFLSSLFTSIQSAETGLGIVFSIASLILLPGLSEEIGAAVFGDEFSIDYPQIATGLGDAAIQTGLNGGNISASLKNSIAGALGGSASDVAGSGLDSQAVGQLASVAVKAAVQGQNIGAAVRGAVINGSIQGASGMLQYDPSSGTYYDDGTGNGSTDTGYVDSAGFPVDANGNPIGLPASATSSVSTTSDTTGFVTVPYGGNGTGSADVSGVGYEAATATSAATGDGSSSVIDSGGNVTTTATDGTITIDTPNGGTTIISPDGAMTIYDGNGAVTSYASDGSLVPTIDPDTGNTIDAKTGDVINWTPEEYAAGCYMDSDGNMRGPDNDIILSAAEVAQAKADAAASGTSPAAAVAQAAFKNVVPGAKNAQAPAAGRSASTPTAAAQTVTPAMSFTTFAQGMLGVAQQAVNLNNSLVKGTGTPLAGQSLTLSNGAKVTNNGNGTQTTTFLNGHRVTTPLGVAAVDTVATGVNSTTIPPVGQSVTLANGSTVTRNANGTLTTVTAAGQVTTSSVPSTLSSSTLMLLGIGALGLFALSKSPSRAHA